MQLEDGVLTWTPDESYTYKLWTGTEYIDGDGQGQLRDPQDVYGYSLVAVDENGIAGELPSRSSEPGGDTYLTMKQRMRNSTWNHALPTPSRAIPAPAMCRTTARMAARHHLTVNVPKEGDYLVSALYNKWRRHNRR